MQKEGSPMYNSWIELLLYKLKIFDLISNQVVMIVGLFEKIFQLK